MLSWYRMARTDFRSKLWLLLIRLLSSLGVHVATGNPLAPALFVFGDSVADVGNNNNNNLSCAKANFPPYGCNFPNGDSTGRFTNGYNPVDFLAMYLGLPLIPKFMDTSTKDKLLLQGVNFASGGSGIEDYTGKIFGAVTTLKQQIQNFMRVKEEIIFFSGLDSVQSIISNAVYYIITGSNDWLNTYFLPHSPLALLYTVEEFQHILISSLITCIAVLYDAGARKIGVAGLGPLGCAPSQLYKYKTNGTCVESLNMIARNYNKALQRGLFVWNAKHPNARIFYNNVYDPIFGAIQNPSAFGFKNVNVACCGMGDFGGFLICGTVFPVCNNDQDYVFWDAYHPTSKMYQHLVELIWFSGPPYSYPASLSKIVA